MKAKIRSSSFTLLIAAVIAGSLLGSGVALASNLYYTMSVGWNYISGNQYDTLGGWSYDIQTWEWLNSDKTRVDFDDIRYYNGNGDSREPTFGELYVSDVHYNDFTAYWDFNGWPIEGIDRTADPYPNFIMDTINSSNNLVVLEQFVWYGAGRFSDSVQATVPY